MESSPFPSFVAYSFKVRIRVPASSALSDRCKNGKIEYTSTATLLGSGSVFKSDLSTSKTVWVVSDPSNEDRREWTLRLRDARRTDDLTICVSFLPTVLQFQECQEGISPILGAFALELVSTEFLVGAPLS